MSKTMTHESRMKKKRREKRETSHHSERTGSAVECECARLYKFMVLVPATSLPPPNRMCTIVVVVVADAVAVHDDVVCVARNCLYFIAR